MAVTVAERAEGGKGNVRPRGIRQSFCWGRNKLDSGAREKMELGGKHGITGVFDGIGREIHGKRREYRCGFRWVGKKVRFGGISGITGFFAGKWWDEGGISQRAGSRSDLGWVVESGSREVCMTSKATR